MAPKGVVAAAQKDLPKDPEELLEQVQANALHPLAERENARAFDYLWSTAWTAAVKLQDYRYTSFTSPASHVQPKLEDITSSDRRRLFAEKSVLMARLWHPADRPTLRRYNYQARLPDTTRNAAQAFEKTLVKDGEVEWQNLVEDGDMLALTQLFSDNLVS